MDGVNSGVAIGFSVLNWPDITRRQHAVLLAGQMLLLARRATGGASDTRNEPE
jgi:hypothetical protein